MDDRVRRNSPSKFNNEIDQQLKLSIDEYLNGDQKNINSRLKQLDKEWDIERGLEVNMPIVALIGLALGIFVSKWWFIFPVIVLLFFLEHAIQGWCPPLPIFRKLGFRTRKEIDKEKYALKLLRGDFDQVMTASSLQEDQVYKAVSKS
jgi:hypothetical protein